jgi:hypothetical protein
MGLPMGANLEAPAGQPVKEQEAGATTPALQPLVGGLTCPLTNNFYPSRIGQNFNQNSKTGKIGVTGLESIRGSRMTGNFPN